MVMNDFQMCVHLSDCHLLVVFAVNICSLGMRDRWCPIASQRPQACCGEDVSWGTVYTSTSDVVSLQLGARSGEQCVLVSCTVNRNTLHVSLCPCACICVVWSA